MLVGIILFSNDFYKMRLFLWCKYQNWK